ncbi:MAG: 5-formyltetrahydrofolate cyclo-ligase [Cocleimonas sp.]|nr:5-formyltetrahydrofolate cyclo-ligase [Cocleimonas sp.]
MKIKISKNTLRIQLRQQRHVLTKKQQANYSQQICQQVAQSSCFRKAQNIAFYTPVQGEASPLPLQKMANKSFYLPVLSSAQAFHLIFIKINKETQYKKNIYGIPEPIHTTKDIIPSEKLDLVIMPLVAVDKEGNRMGMGGGYYDRSFAFKKDQKISYPQLLGFAYDFQLVEAISTEPWDVPLDFIASNKEFIEC